jgi:hypothetical protein
VVKASPGASSQTSGSFELRRPRSTPTGSRPVEARRSVVIDTALVEVVAAGPVASGSSSTLPSMETAPSEPPASAAQVPEAAPVAAEAGQIHEEMPRAPSRPTARTPQPAVSVELRGLPTDEPKTPALALPIAEVRKEPSGARVTGEMRVVSSGKSRMPSKVGAKSSFHIDPSLTVDVPADKPAPAHEDAPVVQPNQGVHRPSGSFSAIESDFFEREADLYKVDKTESFADLDEQKSKSAEKGRPSGGPSKRK